MRRYTCDQCGTELRADKNQSCFSLTEARRNLIGDGDVVPGKLYHLCSYDCLVALMESDDGGKTWRDQGPLL